MWISHNILLLKIDTRLINKIKFAKRKIMETFKDLWLFMKERKKFWLAPIIIVLLLVGLLLVFGGSSSVAPFVYTLF